MSDSIIDSNSIINIYGINYFINKSPDTSRTDLRVLDLNILKEELKLDYNYNEDNSTIKKSQQPAFTQLTYNVRETISDGGYSTSYNRPPIGPIENYCYCSYCNNISPSFHTETCPFPEPKSLNLTIEGIYYYIIQNDDYSYSKDINELKVKWLNKTITNDELNKFLVFESENVTNGVVQYEENQTESNISYTDIVKKRGPAKQEKTTVTQKFGNAIILSYEYKENSIIKKTSIRIYSNGLINFIGIPKEQSARNALFKNLINRINDVPDAIKDEVFKTDEYKYGIIKRFSYTHSLNAQFNLWKNKEKYIINFTNLNTLISPLDSRGRIRNGRYSTITNVNNKQTINLKYDEDIIQIKNWEFTNREEIKCTAIPADGIKISVLIHKYGTIQLSMSYCNPSDIQNNICNKIIPHNDSKFLIEYLNTIRKIFTGIFIENPDLILENITYTELSDSKLVKNTVSGNAPPKKHGTTTETCRAKVPNYPDQRPTPYSFSGTCPESNSQYIAPQGILGNDDLYYPCCATKTGVNQKEYIQVLKEGFPKNEAEMIEYGVNKEQDTRSGILVPRTIDLGATTRALIDNKWKKIEIVNYVEANGRISKKIPARPKRFQVRVLDTDELQIIDRDRLERDSRFFIGLNKLNKGQLINCIISNLPKLTFETMVNLENLKELQSKITVVTPTFNPILTVHGLDDFTFQRYYVTSVPDNSNMYYLYLSPNDIYYIDQNGNKKVTSLSIKVEGTIILLGFLTENDVYYITDILYQGETLESKSFEKVRLQKLNQLSSLIDNFDMEENLRLPEYDLSNSIIQTSKDLLIQNSDIFLVFTPSRNYTNLHIWKDIEINPEITLQILQKNNTNNYSLGFDNKLVKNLYLNLTNVTISSKFLKEKDISVGDYVSFRFEFNTITKELATKYLTPIKKIENVLLNYEETSIKLSLIVYPLTEAFFYNNNLGDDNYIWFIPKRDDYYEANEENILVKK